MLIDVEAAQEHYQNTKTEHKVPSDPCFNGTASESKTFMYVRDHFTSEMDCFLRISVIIINGNTEQGIQLRKYQTYLL